MKKVIKKVVAKAPVKKTVAKKPMMKSGGTKKPLRKAQDGMYQGPVTEEASNVIDYLNRSNNNPFATGKGPTASGINYSRYPLSTETAINSVKQYDLNPKNSKKINKADSNKRRQSIGKSLSKDKEVVKLQKKDWKNIPKNDPQKKELRQIVTGSLLGTAGTALATAFTNNPISRAYKKAWNLEKKKGGTIKSTAKKTMVKSKKK